MRASEFTRRPQDRMRHSLRIPYHDYASAAYYFVTICSYKRKNLFAFDPIEPTAKMAPAFRRRTPSADRLTVIGKIILKNWLRIPRDNVRTDAFVIMPDHIHGIVCISPNFHGQNKDRSQEAGRSVQENHPPSLGLIIGAFKSRCTVDYLNFIKENGVERSAIIWQRGYYDHIIRDTRELLVVRNYIKRNSSRRE